MAGDKSTHAVREPAGTVLRDMCPSDELHIHVSFAKLLALRGRRWTNKYFASYDLASHDSVALAARSDVSKFGRARVLVKAAVFGVHRQIVSC